jgi:hypothetical protein
MKTAKSAPLRLRPMQHATCDATHTTHRCVHQVRIADVVLDEAAAEDDHRRFLRRHSERVDRTDVLNKVHD